MQIHLITACRSLRFCLVMPSDALWICSWKIVPSVDFPRRQPSHNAGVAMDLCLQSQTVGQVSTQGLSYATTSSRHQPGAPGTSGDPALCAALTAAASQPTAAPQRQQRPQRRPCGAGRLAEDLLQTLLQMILLGCRCCPRLSKKKHRQQVRHPLWCQAFRIAVAEPPLPVCSAAR